MNTEITVEEPGSIPDALQKFLASINDPGFTGQITKDFDRMHSALGIRTLGYQVVLETGEKGNVHIIQDQEFSEYDTVELTDLTGSNTTTYEFEYPELVKNLARWGIEPWVEETNGQP